MRRLNFVSIVFAGSISLGGSAFGHSIITQKAVSIDLATDLAQAALAQCKANGFSVAVAVLDRDGELQVFLRGDNTAPHMSELARRKAYTALTFRRTSAEWATRTEPPAELSQQRNLSQVIGLSGGVPIKVDGETIGGLGVSGSTGAGKDEACAVAALAKYADKLK